MVTRLSNNKNTMRKILFIFVVTVFFVSSKAQTGALKFQSTNYDFGLFDTSISGKIGNCSFQFKNIGTEAVTIDKVVLTTGDIRVDYPKTPIMPNEEGKIVVIYNFERMLSSMLDNNELSRSFKKALNVQLKSIPSRIRLSIQGTIKAGIPEKQEMKGKDGYVWYKVYKNERFGACDTNGSIIVPAIFSDISYFNKSDKSADGFLVKDGKNVGFYNLSGKLIIPTQRGYIDLHKNSTPSMGTYYNFQKEGFAGFCNVEGKEVALFPFDNPQLLKINLEDEMIIPCYRKGKFYIEITRFFKTGKYDIFGTQKLDVRSCIIDGDGNIIIKYVNGIIELDEETNCFSYYNDEQKKNIVCGKLSDIKTNKNPLVGNPMEKTY